VLVALAVVLPWGLPGDQLLLVAAVLSVALVGLAAVLPPGWRRGPLGAGGTVMGLTALVPLAAALVALAVPATTAALPWRGVATIEAERTGAATPAVLLAALVLAGGAALLAAVAGRGRLALPGALAGGLTAVLIAPVALSLPLVAVLAGLGALTAVAAALPSRWTGGLALGLAGLTVAWSLASRPATLTVLAGLAVLAAAVAGGGRPVATRTVAAGTGVLALAGEAAAVPLAAGSTVRPAGFLLLGVVAAATGTAAALRRTAPAEALAVELAAVPAAAAGLALAATRGWTASAAFGVLGAILAAAALRPDRRPLAYPAAAAVQLAGWIALATGGISTPEAYTVPLSLLLLAVGLLRRRPGPATPSSWLAYGPALTVTAGPSLVAALAGGTDLRPLLLGTAAVATVLLGARARLRAPLAVGAAVLGVLALHELGPALAGLTADLPRWLPPALGGALLLAVGSTYERRLADLRRARAAYARLG
jgi:hypothetical protein